MGLDIKMNISEQAASALWYKGPKVNTKSFNNFMNVSCFKISRGPLIIGDPLDNQSAPVRRQIKRLTAHGTCGITGTRAFPSVDTSHVEHVATGQCAVSLMGHGSETH